MLKEMTFAIFCLENYKSYKNLDGRDVYSLFDRYGVFEYIKEFYDVLHTTGYRYIIEDIDIYLKARGVTFN